MKAYNKSNKNIKMKKNIAWKHHLKHWKHSKQRCQHLDWYGDIDYFFIANFF